MPVYAWEYGLICLHAVQRELLLFTAFWFILGALDDIGVDLCWIVLRLKGGARDGTITHEQMAQPLQGRAAILIASWHEASVIGHTVSHALSAWQQQAYTLYLGCYCNDPDTIGAAMAAAGSDPRIRIVINENPGPTTKADCLNRVYRALCEDELAGGRRYRSLILHDSEDMVHPAELVVIDAGLAQADFVQLPVRPEPQPRSPWVAGHYSDEFAEEHGKGLVVRDALGAAIPAAGVACGFGREMIARIASRRGDGCGPFAAECLTEDYELGHLVRREGGRSRFMRLRERDPDGNLVASRAYFPGTWLAAVRQKSRWIHGISFQGWDRLGWGQGAADLWMSLRDRRGPLTALVLSCAYILVLIQGVIGLFWAMGMSVEQSIPDVLRVMLYLCLGSFLWRCLTRFVFTTREYGAVEGLMGIARIPVANVIAILAGRRALAGYIGSLRGLGVKWEKTDHAGHPTANTPYGASAI